VLKREMRSRCFPTAETVLCIIHQKNLVRKLFSHIDPSVGNELFGEQNPNKWRPCRCPVCPLRVPVRKFVIWPLN
jgi:hypothetical protein